jgi:hypothetical protein
MTQLRKLGNRKGMNVGGLTINIREGTGNVKMASEFYLMGSGLQLNLLDDWISLLEEMHNAETKESGTLSSRIQKQRPSRGIRTFDGGEE